MQGVCSANIRLGVLLHEIKYLQPTRCLFPGNATARYTRFLKPLATGLKVCVELNNSPSAEFLQTTLLLRKAGPESRLKKTQFRQIWKHLTPLVTSVLELTK